MELAEIKQQLSTGDIPFLAKATGFSKELVRKVLAGERNNDTVLMAAEMLVKSKKSLLEQIEIMAEA